MYLKRITNDLKLNKLNYDFAKDLRNEVDPDLDLDFWSIKELLDNPTYYYYEIYKDDKCENMIGFVAFWIVRHLFSSLVYGALDNIYIIPRCRGYFGGKIIKEVERLVKANGGRQMWWSPHPDTFMDDNFKRREKIYYRYGITYVRKL